MARRTAEILAPNHSAQILDLAGKKLLKKDAGDGGRDELLRNTVRVAKLAPKGSIQGRVCRALLYGSLKKQLRDEITENDGLYLAKTNGTYVAALRDFATLTSPDDGGASSTRKGTYAEELKKFVETRARYTWREEWVEWLRGKLEEDQPSAPSRTLAEKFLESIKGPDGELPDDAPELTQVTTKINALKSKLEKDDKSVAELDTQ